MTVKELRTAYISYFEQKGHVAIPSARLVPENDATTLFIGSGMQPLLPYLLGEKHPSGTRLTNAQKCFRAEDIEEIGDNRHTTFFEMLGNWSLGDYFKEEQLSFIYTFLTKEIGLSPTRLYVTAFLGDKQAGIPRDEISVELWQKLFMADGIEAKAVELVSVAQGGSLGMQGGRIFYFDAKKNWWSRSGLPQHMPAGEPGGPDSEIFFDFHPDLKDTCLVSGFGKYCHPNCNCGRFMEIGNSVFMQYLKREDGLFIELPQKNIDFGGGLERMVAAVNDTDDIFSIDVFSTLTREIELLSGKKYTENTAPFRIIADHIRGAVFMIADGVAPSNTDAGYFVRRLIRRAVRQLDSIGVENSSLGSLAKTIIDSYGDVYINLDTHKESIEESIVNEETLFRTTLKNGLKEFKKIATSDISGKDAFILFSSYGFPIEMTIELAQEVGKNVNISSFKEEMKKHQALSRAGADQKFKGGLSNNSAKTTMLHTTTHLLLAGLQKYLGDDVHQAGSNITDERTRFDFTYAKKVERNVLDQVEAYVNEAIHKKCTVTITSMPKEEAKEAGVEGSFWEKYPDRVNVYMITGSDGTVYSKELCGGPHVTTTNDIKGTFRIVKEEASSRGVRRIKAILE